MYATLHIIIHTKNHKVYRVYNIQHMIQTWSDVGANRLHPKAMRPPSLTLDLPPNPEPQRQILKPYTQNPSFQKQSPQTINPKPKP